MAPPGMGRQGQSRAAQGEESALPKGRRESPRKRQAFEVIPGEFPSSPGPMFGFETHPCALTLRWVFSSLAQLVVLNHLCLAQLIRPQ